MCKSTRQNHSVQAPLERKPTNRQLNGILMPATKIKIILAKCLDAAAPADAVPDFASIS